MPFPPVRGRGGSSDPGRRPRLPIRRAEPFRHPPSGARVLLPPEDSSRLRWRGRRQIPGARSVKLTLSAVLAYAAALAATGDRAPVLAALTALLVGQATVHTAVTSAGRRIASVVAGVIVASFLSTAVGLTWWTLGATVLAALLLGSLLRLRESLLEVPISAMLVLAVEGSRPFAVDRVYETLVGAAVAVAVNVVLPPPLYAQAAGDALQTLGTAIAQLLTQVGEQLPKQWSPAQARAWLEDARRLDDQIAAARRAVARAEDSRRLNPRQRTVRHSQPALGNGLAALEHVAITVRGLTAAILDRVQGIDPDDAVDAERLPAPVLRSELGGAVAEAGRAVAAFAAVVGTDVAGPPRNEQPLLAALAAGRERQAAVTEAMAGRCRAGTRPLAGARRHPDAPRTADA